MSARFTHRLLSRQAADLLIRNSLVSVVVFAFDLALLWVLVEYWGWGKVAAATLAFIAANTLHYVLGRAWVFRGSQRGVAAGYIYFLLNAGVGLVVTLALFAALMDLLGLYYLHARVLASVFAGLVVFLLNALFNFRSL